MSYLGIDVGTTGVKSALVAENGYILALAYQEYNHSSQIPGWAELDSKEVFEKIKLTIQKVIADYPSETIEGISVTSLGEAVVPVTKDRKILGSSILNFDRRGEEFLEYLKESLSNDSFYEISGNTLRNQFTLTKLMWIKKHKSDLYKQTDLFLPWISFVSFMLGADPLVDFSLANRTLLFDINSESWSDKILGISGLDPEKLPETKMAGTIIGEVSSIAGKELGLKPGIPIILGAHDQCANAVGCGAIEEGMAMLGMGTFTCATPVYRQSLEKELLIRLGVNTEHHAVPGRFVSFIYNHGGSVVKWFRDTFACEENRLAREKGLDIYSRLFSELPDHPVNQVYLPYLSTTGLPDFDPNTAGVFSGIRLDSKRGDILKGIIQGIIFDLKLTLSSLGQEGVVINDFRAVGGGSRSDSWVQTCADILNATMTIPENSESGVLGSAIISCVGLKKFQDYPTAVKNMVALRKVFYPNGKYRDGYEELFGHFMKLKTITGEYLYQLSQI
jgi:xylulokinase